MSFSPNNLNGQAVSASSAPVVIASDQSKVAVSVNAGQASTVTGTAGSLNADGYPATDVSIYNFLSVQITGTWVGTITFQASNDNSTWFSTTLINTGGTNTAGNISTSANGMFYGPVTGQYFRVRMTSYTSGTASVSTVLKTIPVATHSVGTASLLAGRTTGGLAGFRIKSAASTNATLVKASAAGLYGLVLSNDNAAKRYFKIYNKATAPTVGTDTPVTTILIPPSSTVSVTMSDIAVSTLPTGLSFAITGAITDADTSAIGADDVHGLIWYG
ncbi:MAG: hypothetical protein JWL89_661 [Candidatus Saccharibacteria bacterium]|jgi:hypothetical protein|nr:hypothetical protein [Candidatus Saccharibacteria bacterium]